MPGTFVEENAQELERLRNLVDRVTDEDLKVQVGDNGTVSALLAHLAFWDYRAVVLLNRWTKTGVAASPVDVDGVNDAVLPLCSALAPRVAANLAVSAAEAADRAVASASPETLAGIEALGGKLKTRRWEHRRAHLDQIEQALDRAVRPTLSTIL
ncbi:MAG: hypothetical protein M1570_18665 [Chloroflexi bacterium]|nr:hypothetical protein [Chloroflexota bacterium]